MAKFYEHKLNKGRTFKNDYKKASNHPDEVGTVNCDGIFMHISLWANADGGHSISFTSREDQEKFANNSRAKKAEAKSEESEPEQPTTETETEDDTPF